MTERSTSEMTTTAMTSTLWVTVAQCQGLAGLPSSATNVRAWLKRHAGEGDVRHREGGRGYEYRLSVLPKAVQVAWLCTQALPEEITLKGEVVDRVVDGAAFIDEVEEVTGAPDGEGPDSGTEDAMTLPGNAVLNSPASAQGMRVPTPAEALAWEGLTLRQRQVALARAGVVRRVARLTLVVGKQAAVREIAKAISAQALQGLLPSHLKIALGQRAELGERTVYQWCLLAASGISALAPKVRMKQAGLPAWWASFAVHWQRTSCPSVSQAYQAWCAEPGASWREQVSVGQVRHFLAHQPRAFCEQGRVGVRAMRAFSALKRRDSSVLSPNGVWQADGHQFDARVVHPQTGKAYRPEITTIMDWATRKLVGWSISVSESAQAVVEGVCDAIARVGVASVLYCDNGPGYRSEQLAMLGEHVGMSLRHARAYHPHSKGAIERLHQSVWVPLAKGYASYVGPSLCEEGRRRIERGDIPPVDFDTFVSDVADAVAKYNARPHSALARVWEARDETREGNVGSAGNGTGNSTGKGGWRHQCPDEAWAAHERAGWQAVRVESDWLAVLVRPSRVVTSRRTLVRLRGVDYSAPVLAPWHGRQVRVQWEVMRDGSARTQVWVYELSGRLIGVADRHAHVSPAMSPDVMRSANTTRARAALAGHGAHQALGGMPIGALMNTCAQAGPVDGVRLHTTAHAVSLPPSPPSPRPPHQTQQQTQQQQQQSTTASPTLGWISVASLGREPHHEMPAQELPAHGIPKAITQSHSFFHEHMHYAHERPLGWVTVSELGLVPASMLSADLRYRDASHSARLPA